jgi:3-dehydroquinate synthase
MESSFVWNSKTRVEFLKRPPSRAKLTECLASPHEKYLVIYDKKLKRSEATKKWLNEFKFTYAVDGGEGLKDFSDFAYHLKKIFQLVSPFSPQTLCVVAVGGGSIGDFAGFLASIMKRGVSLIHVPTTLLAAMDSAHGGKTALNVRGFKNQVGTFYPADAVLVVRSLFDGLPAIQLQSAAGELAKMALIAGGDLFEKFKSDFKLDLESIWELLPAVIAEKYKVVERDPFEKTGDRQILNFGHSLGHALETYFTMPHGLAVGEGVLFALEWSGHQGYWRSGDDLKQVIALVRERVQLETPADFAQKYRRMRRTQLAKIIREDKKLTDSRHLTFVFLEKIGVPFRKVVTVDSLLTETQRQGWTSA